MDERQPKRCEQIINLFLVLLPWVMIGWIFTWGTFFGPNQGWPIGDGVLYRWSLRAGMYSGFAMAAYDSVRMLVNRSGYVLLALAALSAIVAALLCPAFAFA